MVFPAGAGVIPVEIAANEGESSFPRRCGGDPEIMRPQFVEVMFSPQVRG